MGGVATIRALEIDRHTWQPHTGEVARRSKMHRRSLCHITGESGCLTAKAIPGYVIEALRPGVLVAPHRCRAAPSFKLPRYPKAGLRLSEFCLNSVMYIVLLLPFFLTASATMALKRLLCTTIGGTVVSVVHKIQPLKILSRGIL